MADLGEKEVGSRVVRVSEDPDSDDGDDEGRN